MNVNIVRTLYYWNKLENYSFTSFSNVFTNLPLKYMETYCKVFKKEILDKILIVKDCFGVVEAEITTKITKLRPRVRIYNVGISNYGITYEEGKKITWKDGSSAIYAFLKYSLFR